MAYQSYGMAAQPQPTNQTIPSQFPQQNVQPLFPQPQGNVYSINSTLEVANVPVGAGISVALCLPENVMYIKTMQNGNPLFYPYKVIPFEQVEGTAAQSEKKETSSISIEDLSSQVKRCSEKIEILEEKLNKKERKFDI